MKKKQQKKRKYDRNKNLALEKNCNPKTRRDYIDYDYIDKLSPEEKRWLNNFTEEYIGANFLHPGKKLHKEKHKKDCYNRNNARNRDLFNICKTSGNLIHNDDMHKTVLEKKEDTKSPEDMLIDMIDLSKALKDT